MTDGLYLYGVVGVADAPLGPVLGLAGGVSIIEQDGLGAIVGTPPKDGFQELSREQAVRLLLGHQQVLEAAMGETAVLPVKFGTVAPDEAAVRRLLHQGRNLLKEQLTEFGRCTQFEIVVSWLPDSIFAEIAREPEILETRKAAAADSGQEAAVQLGQMVKAALERRRGHLQAQLYKTLSPLAIDLAFNAPMDDRMAANLAVLAGHADAGRLHAALEKLDAGFGGKFTFRCVGPLPPASFATVQVGFPSAQQIDRARQVLGLSGPASQEVITSAFRRLARENHPDLDAANKENAGRMGELMAAYRFLLSCEKSQKLSAESEENAGVLAAGADAGEPVLIEIVGQKSDGSSKRQRSAA